MWLKLAKPIDYLIDGVSMYRLLLYYLIGLILAAVGLSAAGVMHYSPIDIIVSAAILVFSCWAINRILAAIFNAPINPESSILTGLILALIIPSHPSGFSLLFLLAAAGLAMGSKYILAIKGKHIFNPAAVAVFLTAVGPHQTASWWVGTSSMLPFVLIGGILLMRKVRRESMVITYLAATTAATALFSLLEHVSPATNLSFMVLNSAAFFLGFVMLTEPYSSPDTKGKRMIYAVIVGVILAPQFHIGHIYSTPEAALVIGNIFAYLVSSKDKLFMSLRKKYLIAKDSAEFAFATPEGFSFKPGQYMEFTMPHQKPDSRGARRYFTLASSPTEDELRIGVRFYREGSTFKYGLSHMKEGDSLVAGQLSGDFVMPSDEKRKLLFIAGGIGVTPFRSMIKYLIDTRDRRDVVLLYGVSSADQVAYYKLFEQARSSVGLKSFYFISDKHEKAKLNNMVNSKITPELVSRCVPDLLERTVYISGPLPMIEDLSQALNELGVKRANIKVDFFSGYA